MPTLRYAVVLALVFVAASPSSGAAQSASEQHLAFRVRSLQRRVDDLERRLAALEQPARLATYCDTTGPGSPVEIAHWRQLRDGMGYDAVRRILGEPDRVSGGTIAHWCYPQGGQVTFTSGRVTSWSEPSR